MNDTVDIQDTQVNEVIITDMIERCLDMLDESINKFVGDMSPMEALEFIGTLQNIREREARYVSLCGHMDNQKTHTK
jgi:hypothetical protein